MNMKVKAAEANQINSNSQLFSRSAGTGAHQSSFVDALKESDIKRRNEACEAILQQIDVLSEELKKGPTPADVKKYRSLIGEFVKEASNQSFDLHEETHWDREGNRKNYVLIKQINQTVEELLDAVMSKEKKQINIVARLMEIRGLLVDLYL
jgi:Uncharacterized protein conserved in bacteria